MTVPIEEANALARRIDDLVNQSSVDEYLDTGDALHLLLDAHAFLVRWFHVADLQTTTNQMELFDDSHSD